VTLAFKCQRYSLRLLRLLFRGTCATTNHCPLLCGLTRRACELSLGLTHPHAWLFTTS